MSEASSVQIPLWQYAAESGWEYLTKQEALQLRGGAGGLYFPAVVEAQLLRLNPGVVNHQRAQDVIRQLGLLRPTIAGNRDLLLWMRGEQSVYVPAEKRERNVRLIDFEHLDDNTFQVTEEWSYRNAAFGNRADVMFLINGIPVALVETKRADKRDALAEGIDQVRRYHRETPELLLAPQVFTVTQLLDFYYGGTWSTSMKNLFNWKDEEPGNYERKVKAFFDRERFLRLLRDYIIFLSRDDELTKIILRQHQTRAVEKVIARVADPGKRHGLIWHTQGSGKTLTMITIASRLLRDTSGAEKPTVVMLVDRNELEAQLFKNIAGYGISTVRVADSKRELQEILIGDYRGLVVSMIHKFDGLPANVNTRASVIILVDEAHRTTGGDLGNYLMGALPNATYIGFTGTPVDNLSRGKGTFKVFGVDDERGYLDKYSIAESIEDGTTVRLNYSLAPSNLRVDRETLEKQFLSQADAEGLSDIEDLNAVLDRAVELKELMKAPTRIDPIAASVAKHFRKNVEVMGFKAFLVAVDREACALYKKALDKYLPAEYSQVIISPAHNDPQLLKDYHLGEDAEKQVRKEFAKKGALPKILIVTEKLLTGYDAPILYCMYLDKPMRDHVLLQAIARVNRPYEDEEGLVKPYGFVLDYVGIFEKLESALAFDSDVVSAVIQNIDVLKNLFAAYMRDKAPLYLPWTRGWDDKAKERAIDHFADKTRRQDFYTFFKQLQNLYEILSPDAALRPHIETFQALAELYGLIRNAYSARIIVDKEFTAKTRELLRTQTASDKLELPGSIYQLGPKELAALKQSGSADTTKVLNLRKVLAATVDAESGSKPFLISIGERAEALAELYEDRRISTQQALAEFEKLSQEYIEADAEREHLGLDPNTFAIYRELKLTLDTVSAEQASMVNSIFKRYPDYGWSAHEESKLRSELYKALLPLLGKGALMDVTNKLLTFTRL